MEARSIDKSNQDFGSGTGVTELTSKPPVESVFAQHEQSNLRKDELRLRKHAAKVGFQLLYAEAKNEP